MSVDLPARPAPHRTEGAGRRSRLALGFADQAVSSATNFGLAIAVARAAPVAEFGRFAVVFGLVTVLLGAARAIGPEPYAVRRRHLDRRAAAAQVTGTAALAGVAGAGVLLVLATALGGPWAAPAWAAAVALPGLAVQDATRLVLLAEGRAAAALVGDLVWAGGLAAGLAVAGAAGDVDADRGLLAWGAGAAAAAAVGVVQLRVRPAPRSVRPWLASTRSWWPTFLLEFVLTAAGFQVALVLVAALDGPAAAGGLRGGQTAFGPLAVLFLAAPAVLVAEAGRVRGGARLRLCQAIGAGFALAAGAAGALLLVLPDAVGRAVLGGSWEVSQPLLPALTAYHVSVGANLGAFVLLRASAAVRRSRGVRLASTALMVASVAAGAAAGGAEGAAVGLAGANGATTLLWWRAALAAARDDARDPVAAPAGTTVDTDVERTSGAAP